MSNGETWRTQLRSSTAGNRGRRTMAGKREREKCRKKYFNGRPLPRSELPYLFVPLLTIYRLYLFGAIRALATIRHDSPALPSRTLTYPCQWGSTTLVGASDLEYYRAKTPSRLDTKVLRLSAAQKRRLSLSRAQTL